MNGFSPLKRTQNELQKELAQFKPYPMSPNKRVLLNLAAYELQQGNKWASTYSDIAMDRDISKQYAFAHYNACNLLLTHAKEIK